MNTHTTAGAPKRKWEKPVLQDTSICFEATCYTMHIGGGV